MLMYSVESGNRKVQYFARLSSHMAIVTLLHLCCSSVAAPPRPIHPHPIVTHLYRNTTPPLLSPVATPHRVHTYLTTVQFPHHCHLIFIFHSSTFACHHVFCGARSISSIRLV